MQHCHNPLNLGGRLLKLSRKSREFYTCPKVLRNHPIEKNMETN